MNSFSVCTYNIGSRADDYLFLCTHLDPSLKINSQKEETDFLDKYQTVQEQAAKLLTGKAEVYCLQEVKNEERPLIKSLIERKFEIIHIEGEVFDTAIALDKNRFKEITNHSIDVSDNLYCGKDVAIASATDILTGQRITFVSAHAPGFDFEKVNEKVATDGDSYCHEIVQKLSEIGNSTIKVIGADMNAHPENWNPRFNIFADQGFTVHRQNSATNVNPNDSVEKTREIDFIFTKASPSIWQKIKSIFVSTFQFSATLKTENPLGWDANKNASDHLPVFIEISSRNNISKIRQLWHDACGLFSSCFGTKRPQTV